MRKNIRFFLILSIISLIIFFLDHWGRLDWFKGGFAYLNNPVRRAIRREVNPPADIAGDEKNRLQNRVAVLEAENSKLQDKVRSLEKLLGAPLPPDWKFVPAYNLGVKEGTMTLDQGEKAGIKAGDPVLAENILVGRISEVLPQNCRVDLAGRKNIGFKAHTADSHAEGKIIFDPTLNQLFLTEVLTEFDLNKDELVITAGKDNIFPPGLAVGRISEIAKKEADIYQQATVTPLLSPEELGLVFVRM